MAIPFIAPNVVDAVKELQADLAYFFPELTHFYGYATTPDHNTRRCLDAMVYDSSGVYVGQQGRKNLTYADRIDLGTRVNDFLRKNADHYHLNGVIWNRHVWGFPHDGGTGGRHYGGPYGAARKYTITAHDDHNHIELDGRSFTPLRPTSKPTPPVDPTKPEGSTDYPQPTDCTVYYDKVQPGTTSSDSVYWVQRWLNSVPLPNAPLLKLTGTYDAATVTAAREFQASLGDTVDGDLGPLEVVALWGQASGLNLDLPKPTFVAPEVPVPKPITPQLLISLNGPGGGNWQGAVQSAGTGDWFIAEGQTTADGEDTVFYRFNRAGKYLDSMRCKASKGYSIHCTSFGVSDTNVLWFAWNETRNDVVTVQYQPGATITRDDPGVGAMLRHLGGGNMQVNFSPTRDWMVVRRIRADVDEFRQYAKADVLAELDKPAGKTITVPRLTDKRTLQGFSLNHDDGYLHILTGRPSRNQPTILERWSWDTGLLIDKTTIDLPGEAEGMDGSRFSIKRDHGAARRLDVYRF